MKIKVIVYEEPPENGQVRFYPWFIMGEITMPLVPHVWSTDLFDDNPDGCREMVVKLAIEEALNKSFT